jgi:hypothetical protein
MFMSVGGVCRFCHEGLVQLFAAVQFVYVLRSYSVISLCFVSYVGKALEIEIFRGVWFCIVYEHSTTVVSCVKPRDFAYVYHLCKCRADGLKRESCCDALQ